MQSHRSKTSLRRPHRNTPYVPAAKKHGAFTVVSRCLGIETTRTFNLKSTGNPMTVKELTNFHVVTTKDFPSRPRLLLKRYMEKHGTIFSTSTCRPRTDIVDTVAATVPAQPSNASGGLADAHSMKRTKAPSTQTMTMKVKKFMKVTKSMKAGRK